MTEIETRYWPTEKAAEALAEETGEDRCGVCNGPLDETASGVVFCRQFGFDHYHVEPTEYVERDGQVVAQEPENDPAWRANEERAAYVAGLRQLADALARNPEIPLPSDGVTKYNSLAWMVFGYGDGLDNVTYQQQKEQAAQIRRAFGGTWTKYETDTLFRFRGQLAGLHLEIIVDRAAVCERVVTGTREVTEEVPDPEQLAKVPTVKQTRVEEIVEWQCKPLLAGDDQADQAGKASA